MTDFIESCIGENPSFDTDGYDEQKILIKAMSDVLPIIIEKELTKMQSLCLRLFYVNGKTQTEIARQLHLSQPTVSRHIASAKKITNNRLAYCYYTVKKANNYWLKTM